MVLVLVFESGIVTIILISVVGHKIHPNFGMRDSRSPGVVPEAGMPENDAAGERRNRRTYKRHRRQRGAALRHVLRESRRAGAVAVAAHGTSLRAEDAAT